MAGYDEAIEVQSEDALEDLALFSSVVQEIREIMEKTAQLKAKTPDKWKETVQELRVDGSFHLLTLKKLNRIAQIRCKNAKDATLEAKQKLDGNNLRLQNLQYEISHLDKEINNCLQFKSRHEDIDLVPVEEFYSEAPKEISKPGVTMDHEHLRTLARLDWELENRKSLKKEFKRAHSQKVKICDGIKNRNHDLDSLRPSLETILKSTMPLQEALGDHFTETRALYDNAYLLPQPLYDLFVQSKAYADACDRNMEVQIGGDLGAASRLKDFEMKKVIDATNLYKNLDEEESDSDNDEDQENQRGRRKSTSTAKTSTTEPMIISGSVSKHPLYVSLKIYLELKAENSPYLFLRFYFYPEAEFVTVVPSLELSSASNDIKNSPVIESATLLHDLQQVDKGRDVPQKNATSKHGSDDIVLLEKEHAYIWVQKLAGLLALEEGYAVGKHATFSNMRRIVKLLRRRIASRLSLATQLHKFGGNIVSCDHTIVEKYAPIVLFRLTSWKQIDFKEYSEFKYTSATREIGLVSPSDYFFSATLQRGSSAVVTVAVALSDQFPKQWPLFNIQLRWRGDHTAENNLDIREIEVEVNCRLPVSINGIKNLQNQILSAQMYRLLTLMDVYVETECNTDGSDMPSEFPTNKLCPRMAKGRARLKPYKYNSRYKFQSY